MYLILILNSKTRSEPEVTLIPPKKPSSSKRAHNFQYQEPSNQMEDTPDFQVSRQNLIQEVEKPMEEYVQHKKRSPLKHKFAQYTSHEDDEAVDINERDVVQSPYRQHEFFQKDSTTPDKNKSKNLDHMSNQSANRVQNLYDQYDEENNYSNEINQELVGDIPGDESNEVEILQQEIEEDSLARVQKPPQRQYKRWENQTHYTSIADRVK